MTNKPMLSVERELLELAAYLLERNAPSGGSDEQGAAEELRAILDSPVEEFNPEGWSIDHSAGRPILMHNKCSVIEAEQAYGLLNLIESAAQHQGDEISFEQIRDGISDFLADNMPMKKYTLAEIERMIREVARLNGVKP